MVLRDIVVMCVASAVLCGCYSNNCPMENAVCCNFSFYDAEGAPAARTGAITVTTLKPGRKTVYVYRRTGSMPVWREGPDPALVEEGWTETESVTRNDTVLLNKAAGVSGMALPLSYFNRQDTLVVAYENVSARDTIYVEHDSRPHVELPECGAYRFHRLRSVRATDAAIDRIEIGEPEVNYEGKINIKVYFNDVDTNEED